MKNAKPNIVLITCHDLGQHLGCYGQSSVQSVALDNLASKGVRFENHFCTAPQCSPSRAGMHTGRYPHATGMLGLVNLGWEINPSEQHLAQILRQHGFQTALFGIQHLTENPKRLGYDHVYPMNTALMLAKEAAGYLQKLSQDGQPFYLEIGFFETHRPYNWQGADSDDALGVNLPPYLPESPGALAEFADLQGDILVMDQAGGIVEGDKEPTAEKPLHLSIYRQFPQKNVVIHAHPPYTVHYFYHHETLNPITLEERVYLRKVNTITQKTSTITDLDAIHQALNSNDIAVIKDHGVVAIGEDFKYTFSLIELLETNARLRLISPASP